MAARRPLITSPRNPHVKELLALRRRQEREREGVLLVEGYDELAVALAGGARPLRLYHCPALVPTTAQLEVLARASAAGAEVVEVSESAFRRAAYRQAPDGWLAVFPALPTDLRRLRPRPDALVLVCDAVEKPGNLGAILRAADVAGADAVVASPAVTDWGNPNVVRASRGALFTVPVAEAGHEELLAWLRGHGLAIVAARPEAELPYTAVDLTSGVAIVVGAESEGIGAAWAGETDIDVRIPMFGAVNSLNVAATATLLLYEALRQRGRLAGA